MSRHSFQSRPPCLLAGFATEKKGPEGIEIIRSQQIGPAVFKKRPNRRIVRCASNA